MIAFIRQTWKRAATAAIPALAAACTTPPLPAALPVTAIPTPRPPAPRLPALRPPELRPPELRPPELRPTSPSPPASRPPVTSPQAARQPPTSLPALRAPPRLSSACRVPVVASLALLPQPERRYAVPLSTGATTLAMQIDTGAEVSVLAAATPARLGLSTDAARRSIAGLGGIADQRTATLRHLSLAGLTLGTLSVPVMELVLPSGTAGLIGADLLARTPLRIDPDAARLTLYRPGCAPGPRAPVLPFIGRFALPIVAATLDGRTLPALIDTGASTSTLALDAAGLPADAFAADPLIRSTAAGGRVLTGHLHRFASLAIGAWRIDAPRLRVAALTPGLGIDLVIGMDLLAGHVLLLDTTARTISIDPD